MAADVDDRMALAVEDVNRRLAAVQLGPLSEVELISLRDPYGYRTVLAFLAAAAPADLSDAQALLDEWHAWNTRR